MEHSFEFHAPVVVESPLQTAAHAKGSLARAPLTPNMSRLILTVFIWCCRLCVSESDLSSGSLCWAHPLVFSPLPTYHGLVTSLPIPSHICHNPLQGSQRQRCQGSDSCCN